ncbi:lantibiotic dehydratase C-terminal domain-containing protein [Nocardia sp. NPDC051052]|uniref:lantibiotic dehydratase C-terminal domain-containing protein n=1 Tax=Nocardia sp. NPDC051052 TaxID=3364322 RepID=UPI0037B91B53
MSVNSSSSCLERGPWLSAHIHYHEDLDRLLRRCVGPLVARLGDRVAPCGVYFLRYWQGGPHLRLRLRSADLATIGSLRAVTEESLHRFLRADPSRRPMSPAVYRLTAAAFAAVERGIDPIEDLLPDNTVRFHDFTPEHIPGADQQHPAPLAFYEQSSRVVLSVLERPAPAARRTRLALAHCAAAMGAVADDDDRRAELAAWTYDSWAAQLLGAHRRDIEVRFAERVAGLESVVRRAIDRHTGAAEEPWRSAVRNVPADRLSLAYCLHTHCNRLGINLIEEAYIWFLLRWALT